MLKRLFLVPLAMALLQSCSTVTDSGANSAGYGFASDTTAILFYDLWEDHERFNIPITSRGTNYYGWELKLVDVRFYKVYWSARINYDRSSSQRLTGRQWNDSTMLIELTGEGYWLWTVGNKKPQKVNFNLNCEMGNYKVDERLLLYYGRQNTWPRSWKDNSLLFSEAKVIIDTKTMTVNDWSPTGDDAWVANCDDFWWGKNGGACLVNNNPYGFILLSDKGDTLSNFTYAHECVTYYNDKCYINSYFNRHFIEASLGCELDTFAKNIICGASYAFIRYDDKLNVNKEPSFWWLRAREEFVDSLQNITRY